MAAKDGYLIDTLLDMALVTNEQLDAARAEAESIGEGVVDSLVKQGVIRSKFVAQAKAAYYGNEFVDLGEMRLTDEVIKAIPRHIVKRYNAVPVYKDGDIVRVAVSDPSDLDAIDGLQHSLNTPLEILVASEEDINNAIGRYYGAKDDSVSKLIQDITEGEVELGKLDQVGGLDDGTVVEADAPIIKLVNTIIVDAFKMRASDIHLEPLASKFRVRYRIDGVLHEMKSPPKRLQGSIISRLKIQSNMS